MVGRLANGDEGMKYVVYKFFRSKVLADQLSPHIYSNSSQCRVCMPAMWPSFGPFQWLSVLHACTHDHSVVCPVHYAISSSTTACGGGWMQHVDHGGD